MNADFLGTCHRMYTDATFLFEKSSYYNSCYLCGYVVECFLKSLLLKYARKTDGSELNISDMKNYSHRLPVMINSLKATFDLLPDIPPACRIDLNTACETICVGKGGSERWDPKLRYGTHDKWSDPAYCACYIGEVKELYEVLQMLQIGGYI